MPARKVLNFNGDATGNRTRVTAVKGRCLNRLTIAPYSDVRDTSIPVSRTIYFSKRQRPTFPGGRPPSIISAKELNFCVRDGNRCGLLAIVTAFLLSE